MKIKTIAAHAVFGIGLNLAFKLYATGTIDGYVTDFVRSNGIAGTTVQFITRDNKVVANAVTDSDGYYEQSELPAGTLLIHYTKGGYLRRPTELKVELLDGVHTQKNVQLINETQNSDIEATFVAVRIRDNVHRMSTDDFQAAYTKQWTYFSRFGLSPEFNGKVANSLRGFDSRTTQVPEIKAYMSISPEKLKTATALWDFNSMTSPHPINSDLKYEIPDNIKVEIVRYNLNNTQKTQLEKNLYLTKIEELLGKNVRDQAAISLSSTP